MCYHATNHNQHFLLSTKMNGTWRRRLVSPWRMHCKYCCMPKSTSRAEALFNSEPVVLAVIKLCLSGGISQLVSPGLSFTYPIITWKLRVVFRWFCGPCLLLCGPCYESQYVKVSLFHIFTWFFLHLLICSFSWHKFEVCAILAIYKMKPVQAKYL